MLNSKDLDRLEELAVEWEAKEWDIFSANKDERALFVGDADGSTLHFWMNQIVDDFVVDNIEEELAEYIVALHNSLPQLLELARKGLEVEQGSHIVQNEHFTKHSGLNGDNE
jgi:hypothetical protein